MTTENDSVKHKQDKKKQKGFLSPRGVKSAVFIIMTLCVIFGVVVSILAIWDFAKSDVLWRTLATLGVIWLGSLVFSIINTRFGD